MVTKKLTTALELKVKKQFNHLCAICGKANPHIHHIDGDHYNNDEKNLLPLCPNHHLLDAHSPTDPINPQKLVLFRTYRDPTILLPQFHPVFARMRFVLVFSATDFDAKSFAAKAEELAHFVGHLEMGGFYGEQLKKLLCLRAPLPMPVINPSIEYYEAREKEILKLYLSQVESNIAEAVQLIIEQLRFQTWRQISRYIHA